MHVTNRRYPYYARIVKEAACPVEEARNRIRSREIEELDADDLQVEIDRTALLGDIRSSIFRLEHEKPNVRNPGYWLGHLFQGLYSLLTRNQDTGHGRAH